DNRDKGLRERAHQGESCQHQLQGKGSNRRLTAAPSRPKPTTEVCLAAVSRSLPFRPLLPSPSRPPPALPGERRPRTWPHSSSRRVLAASGTRAAPRGLGTPPIDPGPLAAAPLPNFLQHPPRTPVPVPASLSSQPSRLGMGSRFGCRPQGRPGLYPPPSH